MEGADGHQACRGGHHRVRVLFSDLLPPAASGTLQQTGGTVEPCTQPCCQWVLMRCQPGFIVLRSCKGNRGRSEYSCLQTEGDVAQRKNTGRQIYQEIAEGTSRARHPSLLLALCQKEAQRRQEQLVARVLVYVGGWLLSSSNNFQNQDES